MTATAEVIQAPEGTQTYTHKGERYWYQITETDVEVRVFSGGNMGAIVTRPGFRQWVEPYDPKKHGKLLPVGQR